MGYSMVERYLYTSSDEVPEQVIAGIDEIRSQAHAEEKLPMTTITAVLGGIRNKLEIRFEVSALDYETKHGIDVKIRKLLKRHRVKFLFSDPGHTKLDFY